MMSHSSPSIFSSISRLRVRGDTKSAVEKASAKIASLWVTKRAFFVSIVSFLGFMRCVHFLVFLFSGLEAARERLPSCISQIDFFSSRGSSRRNLCCHFMHSFLCDFYFRSFVFAHLCA